jgi:hypothetical protein
MARNSRRCEGCCLLAEDDFDRAELGPNWEVTADTVAIVDNQLRLTDDGLVYWLGGSFGPADGKRWTFTLTPDADTLLNFWLISAQDAGEVTDGIRVAFDCGSPTPIVDQENCDTFQFLLRSGGSIAANDVTFSVCQEFQPVLWLNEGEAHEVEVCWFPATYPEESIVRVKIRTAAGEFFSAQAQLATALEFTHVGFELAGGGAGGVSIDRWRVWELESDCPQACPQCNSPCLIFEDDFERADGNDPGCAWSAGSGITSEILSGSLIVRAPTLTAGVIRCAVRHPTDSTSHYAFADIRASTGRKTRLAVNMQCDGQRYLCGEVEYTSTTAILRLIRHDTSGETILESESSVRSGEGFDTLTVCFHNGLLTASYSFSSGPTGPTVTIGAVAATTEHEEGVWAGIGSAGSVPAAFESFTFYKYRDLNDDTTLGCPVCPAPVATCDICVDDVAPQFFLVQFSGVISLFGPPFPPPGFAPARDFNVGFIVERGRFVSSQCPPEFACAWSSVVFEFWESAPGLAGGGGFAVVGLQMRDSSTYPGIPPGVKEIVVTIGLTPFPIESSCPQTFVTFLLQTMDDLRCLEFTGLNIPYSGGGSHGFNMPEYYFADSQCRVWSL